MNTQTMARKVGLVCLIIVVKIVASSASSHAHAAEFTALLGANHADASLAAVADAPIHRTLGISISCAAEAIQDGKPLAHCL